MTLGARSSRRTAIYRRVPYRVGQALVRIGRRCPAALDTLLEAHGARGGGVLVTAWNPGGGRLPEAVNRRRAARLAERLRGLCALPGVNGEGRWREESVLVFAARPRVEALGRLFGQDAVVLVRRGRRARLRFLR
jgi:Protein of unknown function (DUF3293)